MPEAPVRMSKHGLVVGGEGWFVVNASDSRWKDEGPLGSYCSFEGKRRFPHFGINISVLEPGEQMGMYHREKGQEAFLGPAGSPKTTEEALRWPTAFRCAALASLFSRWSTWRPPRLSEIVSFEDDDRGRSFYVADPDGNVVECWTWDVRGHLAS